MPGIKLWTASALTIAVCFFVSCAHGAETQAAAVIDDGYAGTAMQKILNKYTGRGGGQRLEARLYLDEEGRLLDCRAIKGDVKALCQAAKSASPFGEPPYGVPTNIAISIWTGKGETKTTSAKDTGQHQANAAKGQADSKYLGKIRRELRNAMYIPAKTQPGTYHVVARVKCDAAGKILDSSIIKGSGDSLLDKYVLQGIHRAGSITAPPAGAGDTFDITFTLVR